MAYQHQTKVSPLKRIRAARGMSLAKLAVISGVDLKTIRKLERMQWAVVGKMRIESVMRVALALKCKPVELIPILGVSVKKTQGEHGSGGTSPWVSQKPAPPKKLGPVTHVRYCAGCGVTEGNYHRDWCETMKSVEEPLAEGLGTDDDE